MSKASVSLLLASLVVGVPTSSQAGPITLRYLNDSFATVVISLNRMRVFSNACGMSKTTELIALEFMTNFSVKAGVSMVDVNKWVQAAYSTAPEATRPAQACDMKYVEFWTDSFRQQAQYLDEDLTQYIQQK
jgi:hypothetical protein